MVRRDVDERGGPAAAAIPPVAPASASALAVSVPAQADGDEPLVALWLA